MRVFDQSFRPFFFKLLVTPVQFGSSLFAWRYFFDDLNSRDIILIGAILSFQFISVVSLLGSHVSISNAVIDGKTLTNRTIVHSFITSAIFFLVLFIVIEFSKYPSLHQIGISQPSPRLILLTLLCFLSVSPTALVQSVVVVSGSANSVNISAGISSFFLLLGIGILQVKNVVLNIEGVLTLLFVSQLSGLIYLLFVMNKLPKRRDLHVKYRDFIVYFNFGAWLISIVAPLAGQMDRYLVAKYGSIQQTLDINAINRIMFAIFPILSWVGALFWNEARSRPNFKTLFRHLQVMLVVLIFFSAFIFIFLSTLMEFILPAAGKVTVELKIVLVINIVFYGLFIIFGTYLSSKRGQFFLATCSGVFFLLNVKLSPVWLQTPSIVGYYSGLIFIQFFILLLPTIIYSLILARRSTLFLDLD